MRLTEVEVVETVRRVRLEELRDWVAEGWVRPAQGAHGPVFDELDVARVRLVCDLREEVSLPADAMPVVLSLLDQVHGLRRQLRGLAGAVDRQPDAVRRAVLAAWQEMDGPEG
ncbi:chaperone modulator CbpM [Roseovarius salis]|uniref:chaperone modulator CbpM n=1 Tax=Roseovarius salis TaxID=3376063 RepID=UPI0037CA05EF